jgi:hypothetical protein
MKSPRISAAQSAALVRWLDGPPTEIELLIARIRAEQARKAKQ